MSLVDWYLQVVALGADSPSSRGWWLASAAAVHPETDLGGALDMGDRARTSSK
eukprot:COSAG05_NODE_1358_length_5103_cov_18.985811_2_plen_53_part_00